MFFGNNPSQLVDLSAAQDVEAGDGTTSVVVLAGSLLGAAEKMLQKGIHPTIIAEAFLKASAKAVEYVTEISTPVDLNDKPSLLRAASTSLNSKVNPFAFFFFFVITHLRIYFVADRLSVFVDFGSYCCGGRNPFSYANLFKC
jgi:TCP-1/cpn60 chaperonin family